MITLKELVQEQTWNDMTDIQIIKAYFELNDLESSGIDIISELTKSKINKIKNKYETAETWVCMLPSKYLYENYSLDIADRLHRLELDYLMNGGELSDKQLKWAKDKFPNIKMPKCYFQPLFVWLEEKGIKFKNEKRI